MRRALAATLLVACSHGGDRPAPPRLAVHVRVENRARSPETVHAALAMPIARALAQVPGVARVTTTADARDVDVTAWMADGVDRIDAVDRIHTSLDPMLARLPGDAPTPELWARAPGPTRRVIVRGASVSPIALRRWVDWDLRRSMLQTTGIREATTCGGLDARVVIAVDPQRLAAYGSDVAQVIEALRHVPAQPPSGTLAASDQQFVVRGLGSATSVDDLRDVAIAANGGGGARVTLADVATIEDTGAPDPCPPGAPADAVVLDLRLDRDGDASRVQDAIVRARATAPAGATIDVVAAPAWFDVALTGRADAATALAERWRTAITGAAGVLGVEPAAPPVTIWDVDAAAAGRAGSTLDVDDAVAAMGDGTEVLEIFRDEVRIPVWLRLGPTDPARVMVHGADGLVPLSTIVRAHPSAGRIESIDLRPAMIVRFTVADGDEAETIAAAAIARARAGAPPPDGVTITTWREP